MFPTLGSIVAYFYGVSSTAAIAWLFFGMAKTSTKFDSIVTTTLITSPAVSQNRVSRRNLLPMSIPALLGGEVTSWRSFIRVGLAAVLTSTSLLLLTISAKPGMFEAVFSAPFHPSTFAFLFASLSLIVPTYLAVLISQWTIVKAACVRSYFLRTLLFLLTILAGILLALTAVALATILIQLAIGKHGSRIPNWDFVRSVAIWAFDWQAFKSGFSLASRFNAAPDGVNIFFPFGIYFYPVLLPSAWLSLLWSSATIAKWIVIRRATSTPAKTFKSGYDAYSLVRTTGCLIACLVAATLLPFVLW